MSAAAQIVKKRGSIVVVADCWDGIPDHGEYSRLLSEADSCESLLRTIRQEGFFKHDMWQVQLHGLILQKADVYFHSHNLSDEQIKGALFRPCSKVEKTVDEILHKYGQDASTPERIGLDVVNAFALQKRLDLTACVPVLSSCDCHPILLLDPVVTIQVLGINWFFNPKRLVLSN